MNRNQTLEDAQNLLEAMATRFSAPEVNRLDVNIEPGNLKDAIKVLVIDGHWGYLSAITGLDQAEYETNSETNEKKAIPDQGSLEMIYHICNGALIVSIRVSVPYAHPTLDTICDLIPSATLYEREAMELFGVVFENTPNTDRLILPEDWPAGVYPLRKAFTGLPKELINPKGRKE